MKILSDAVRAELAAGKPLRLELGSGGYQREGYFGVDQLPLPGVAIQADLSQPLDLLPDNSVGEIVSSHCFEHVSNFMSLIQEMHRVVRPGGRIVTIVPHFSNPYFYSDPTHVRFFGLYTMFYFVSPEKQPGERKVPCFYSPARFSVDEIKINLMPRSLWSRIRWPFLSRHINSSFARAEWYERTLCWQVPANEIIYTMTPIK